MRRWKLKVGDRVVHFRKTSNGYPTGTLTHVDPIAGFFPYWVEWDSPWRRCLAKGAFQSSCFKWDMMHEPINDRIVSNEIPLRHYYK